MNFWLIKSEPETYSLADLRREQVGMWDGVRNYTARNNLRAMQHGDLCFFYRSVTKPAIVGLAKVARESYPDPTVTEEKNPWLAIDIEYVEEFKHEISLATIKTLPELQDMALLKLSRLSVQPVAAEEFELLYKMGKTSPSPSKGGEL
jgi:predicted RNA-binding protein with PUA-like domain